jgi:hypothetical protein
MSAAMMRITSLVSFVGIASAVVLQSEVSPVQKVIQLMDDMEAKVEKDLAAESAAMDEYMSFCKEELREKEYAIKTASREIGELEAQIADNEATMNGAADEVALLSNTIASQEKDLAEAKSKRETQKKDFLAGEKVLTESIQETELALEKLTPEGGASFAQVDVTQMVAVKNALQAVLRGTSINARASRKHLESLLQHASETESDDIDESPSALVQAHGAPSAASFESASGGIVDTVKGMQEKGEQQLADLRKKDVQDQQAFDLLEQGITSEIEHTQEKLATATKTKATSEQALAQAQEDLGATKKTKAEDQNTLRLSS